MSSTHTLALDKFDGSNFHTWQVKVKFHLMREGLWGLIMKTEVKPSTRDGELQWTKRDEKAFAIIALALSDDYIHHVSDINSAAQAWEDLEKLFGAQAKNAKIALKIQFFSLVMNQGTTLATHINSMRSLMIQLAGIGAEVQEDDAVAVLLKSLRDLEEYQNVITTLQNLPDLTLQGVITSLQDEEKKIKRYDLVHTHAFAVNKGINKGGQFQNKSKNPMKCNFCGRTNHLEKDCFFKKKHSVNLVEEEEDVPQASTSTTLMANFVDDSLDSDYAF